MREWAAETIFYRIAVGVFGLIAFAALVAIRRGSVRARLARPLPPLVSDAVATTAFGAAVVWPRGLGIHAMLVRSGHGAGALLSAVPIAVACTAYYGRRLAHEISPRSPAMPSP